MQSFMRTSPTFYDYEKDAVRFEVSEVERRQSVMSPRKSYATFSNQQFQLLKNVAKWKIQIYGCKEKFILKRKCIHHFCWFCFLKLKMLNYKITSNPAKFLSCIWCIILFHTKNVAFFNGNHNCGSKRSFALVDTYYKMYKLAFILFIDFSVKKFTGFVDFILNRLFQS